MGVGDHMCRAARDEIENKRSVAPLRRLKTESGDDLRQRGLYAARAGRAGRGSRTLVLRREERRIDHHRAQEFVAEIAREPHRRPAAERMADHDRRSGVECARRTARLPRFAHELLEPVGVAPV